MSASEENAATPSAPATSNGRRPVRWAIVGAVVLTVGAAAGIGATLADDGTGSPPGRGGPGPGTSQQACQEWMHDRSAMPGFDASRCSVTTGWMHGDMHRDMHDMGQMHG